MAAGELDGVRAQLRASQVQNAAAADEIRKLSGKIEMALSEARASKAAAESVRRVLTSETAEHRAELERLRREAVAQEVAIDTLRERTIKAETAVAAAGGAGGARSEADDNPGVVARVSEGRVSSVLTTSNPRALLASVGRAERPAAGAGSSAMSEAEAEKLRTVCTAQQAELERLRVVCTAQQAELALARTKESELVAAEDERSRKFEAFRTSLTGEVKSSGRALTELRVSSLSQAKELERLRGEVAAQKVAIQTLLARTLEAEAAFVATGAFIQLGGGECLPGFVERRSYEAARERAAEATAVLVPVTMPRWLPVSGGAGAPVAPAGAFVMASPPGYAPPGGYYPPYFPAPR